MLNSFCAQDSTLVLTKSGRQFSSSPSDWKFWDPCVPQKLTELSKKGYKLVIFSNQGGISKGHTSGAEFKAKLDKIHAEVRTLPTARTI